MKQNKQRKPTNNEMKNAIDNIIVELGFLQRSVRSMDTVISAYIDWKNDTKEFRDWLKEEYEKEKNESRNQHAPESPEGDRKPEVRNINSQESK